MAWGKEAEWKIKPEFATLEKAFAGVGCIDMKYGDQAFRSADNVHPKSQTATAMFKFLQARQAAYGEKDYLVWDFNHNMDFWTGYKAVEDAQRLIGMANKYGIELSNSKGKVTSNSKEKGHFVLANAIKYLAGQEELMQTKGKEK